MARSDHLRPLNKSSEAESFFFPPAFALICIVANLSMKCRKKCDPCRHHQRQRKEIRLHFKGGCCGLLHILIRCLCVYWTPYLQTVWLSGWQWQHRHSPRPRLDESLVCLPRIDLPPICRCAFSFIVSYWRVLKWLWHRVRADVHALQSMHAKKNFENSNSHFCRAYIYFHGPH